MTLFFLQHQLTLLPNHPLCSLGEARKQPGQHDLKSYPLLINIDRALGALPQRRCTKCQSVSGPDLFFERKQPAELTLGAVEPDFYAALGLVLAEAMRFVTTSGSDITGSFLVVERECRGQVRAGKGLGPCGKVARLHPP